MASLDRPPESGDAKVRVNAIEVGAVFSAPSQRKTLFLPQGSTMFRAGAPAP